MKFLIFFSLNLGSHVTCVCMFCVWLVCFFFKVFFFLTLHVLQIKKIFQC